MTRRRPKPRKTKWQKRAEYFEELARSAGLLANHRPEVLGYKPEPRPSLRTLNRFNQL